MRRFQACPACHAEGAGCATSNSGLEDRDAADGLIAHDRSHAERRYQPASSVKRLNSLVALETGAVKDENEFLPR